MIGALKSKTTNIYFQKIWFVNTYKKAKGILIKIIKAKKIKIIKFLPY